MHNALQHFLTDAARVRDRLGHSLNKLGRRRHLKKRAAATAAHETVLFFFPDWRKHNPHQQLLADALPPYHHALPGSLEDALFFQKHARGKTVFHLHWPDPILNRAFPRFLESLQHFRENGGTALWTIHNLLPRHIPAAVAASLQQALARHMDRLHFFTPRTLEQGRELYDVAAEKCVMAMRGNYANYENTVGKEASRRALCLPADKTVVCFFGQLRPYKGLDALLNNFNALARPDTLLVLAGRLRMADRPVMAPILNRARTMPNVRLFPRFIPDAQVQCYLNACDILVLPYTELDNSGAYLLGLSFGCCIVAPHMGSIADLAMPGIDAITYDPADENGLDHALEKALSLSPAERATIGRNAAEKARGLRWEDTAKALCAAIAAAAA